jgi:pyruvate formate lyase activating enzyme
MVVTVMASLTGMVFNIQRFSTEDGPGIRTTVFFKGCPLRCQWCSNPESQSPVLQLACRNSLCIGCGSCIAACPARAIAPGSESKICIDRTLCRSCGVCVKECPAGAMKFFGRLVTLDEVFDEVNSDTAYYANSQGGVTASGGEAMQQADFVGALFRRCHSAGIHTALDTCGYFNSSEFSKVSDCVNLVLFDLKLMDCEKHKRYIGVPNNTILQNARLISRHGIPMIIRVPLIPNINDSEENLTEVARFVMDLESRPSVNLLPYHNYGENKYKMLNMDYQLTGLAAPDEAHMRRCAEVIKQYGLNCSVS